MRTSPIQSQPSFHSSGVSTPNPVYSHEKEQFDNDMALLRGMLSCVDGCHKKKAEQDPTRPTPPSASPMMEGSDDAAPTSGANSGNETQDTDPVNALVKWLLMQTEKLQSLRNGSSDTGTPAASGI